VKLSEIELLRLIYKHLDLEALLKQNPSLTKAEIDEFFRELAPAVRDGLARRGGLARKSQAESPPPRRPGRGAEKVIIYSDGASRGNPGEAGIGVVITDLRGRVLFEEGGPIGRQTNNVAEYAAAIRGLQRAIEMGAHDVTLRADSELLVHQINGRYRVKNPTLAVKLDELRNLARRLRAFRAEYVPREQNAQADALAKAASYGRET